MMQSIVEQWTTEPINTKRCKYASVKQAIIVIGSDNGLFPHHCQVIIWTNSGLFLIKPLGTNISKILTKTH